MLKLVLLLLCAVALGQSADYGFGSIRNYYQQLLNRKIVGGETAGIGEFPHQASLRMKGLLGRNEHFCGGSILSKNVILTAAHCVISVPPFNHIEVNVGFNNLKDPGDNLQISKISKTIVHPDFGGEVGPNDIAIHILETPFTFTDFVQPIGLPEADSLPEGNGLLSGWGSTSTTSTPKYPDELLKATLPFLTYEECQADLEAALGAGKSPLAPTNVCTGPVTGGQGACSGDSGGPLTNLNQTQVIGIVSWGMTPCGTKGYPSVFTRVSHPPFLQFINDQMAAAETLLKPIKSGPTQINE